MAEWFKMHSGDIENTKLAFIAKRFNLKRTLVQATWWLALDMASNAEPRGKFNPTEEEIEMMSFILDENINDLERVILAFSDRKMVINGAIADWSKTQSMSSAGAARQAKYLAKKKKEQEDLERFSNSDKKTVIGDTESVISDGGNDRNDENQPLIYNNIKEDNKSMSVTDDFLKFWDLRPCKSGKPDSKTKALAEWKETRLLGISAEKLINSMRAYADYCERESIESKYIKLTYNFLRDGVWEDYADIPEPKIDTLEDLPEWKQKLGRVLGAVKVRNLFDGTRFDGKDIVFINGWACDRIKNHFEHDVKQALGNVNLLKGVKL